MEIMSDSLADTVESNKESFTDDELKHLPLILKLSEKSRNRSLRLKRKIQDLRQESIKWNQNRKILQQDIWKNVLKSGFSEEKFCETAAQRQLSYGPGHYFRLICLMPEIKSNKREMWDTATMEFVIEKCAVGTV